MLQRHGKHLVASASLFLAAIACCAAALAAAANTLLWQTNLEQAKQIAAQSNRLILVHFWSPSCGPCKQLEKNVFAVPQVQQSIQARFVPVKVNADDWPTTTKQYGITVLPTDLIITPTGQIIGRMVSPPTPDEYLQKLAIASSGAGNMAAPPAAAYAAAPPAAGVYAAPMAPTSPVAPMNGAPMYSAPPPTTGWAPAPSSVPPAVAVAPSAPSAYAAAPAVPSSAMPVMPAAAAPNVAWGAAPAPSNNAAPAVPAYSDSRYAEYYQRFSTASNPAVPPAGNPASVAPPVTMPAAAAMQPAYAPPAYAPPTYSPPAAAPVNYRSTAYGPSAASAAPATAQSATSIPPSASMPANNPPIQPGVTPVAASAPVTASTPMNNGSPQLALDGYCPVTLLEQQRWQVGDRRWGVVHRGHTYLFAGPEQQKKFLADPDRYSPAVSGQDVVMAMDFGQDIAGKRALGVEYQNRIYLFSSDASRQLFAKNPQRYATEVLQAERATTTTLR